MIRSMTAFARVTESLASKAGSAVKDGQWAVEIKSINHRYFEFSLRVPQPGGTGSNRTP